MLVRGTNLPANLQREVLAAFGYRWTRDNPNRLRFYRPCSSCDIREPAVNLTTAEGHNHPTIPMSTDAEWLAAYGFHVTRKGTLDRRHSACEPWRDTVALEVTK